MDFSKVITVEDLRKRLEDFEPTTPILLVSEGRFFLLEGTDVDDFSHLFLLSGQEIKRNALNTVPMRLRKEYK